MGLAAQSPTARIASVDAWRGLIMIVMALDHVRDFFHTVAPVFQPDDLARTTAALFFTRWITHFCAPAFMFSAGMAAFFWVRRGRTTAQLSAFLASRGLWLVILELTVLRLALFFTVTSGPVILTVLWALGWSMVALALLAHLPRGVLAALSIAVIALHNLTDSVKGSRFGALDWLWNILHQPGMFKAGGIPIIVAYPLVPWFAVMALGFCFGPVMLLPAAERRRWLIRTGLAVSLAFIAIRAVNVYGDPFRWHAGLLSFLRCTKYPPSLDFLLMTLGPGFLALAWFDRIALKPTNPLLVFGRVPLFYFIVHMYVAHGLAALAGRTPHLWAVYLWWILVVALLYPLCLWWGRRRPRLRLFAPGQPEHHLQAASPIHS
jgi:uncharacterized membrane protein